MRNSWTCFFRRLAAGCIVSASVAWSSAMCYAVQLAHDTADDPVYADGWQAGDNGGTGFTPWNFDSTIYWQGTLYTYAKPGIKFIDDGLKTGAPNASNPFNDIGRAWGIAETTDSDGTARVGRGFPALQPGQTFSIVVDNPTRRQFFKGYFIRLNGDTGGYNGSICYGNHPCDPASNTKPMLNVGTFEYFTYGQWFAGDAGSIPLFDYHTAAGGMRLDVTLTSADTYDLVMTPLGMTPEGDPVAPPFMHSGTFANPGVPIDWLEITFFNPPTDTGTPPTIATDFYIRRIEITGDAPPGVPGDYNNNNVVDAADYVVWRKLNGTNTQLQNEVSGTTPGSVTIDDYNAWRGLFGDTSGAGSGQGGGAVPEPSTFVCVVCSMAGLMAARRSKRDPGNG